MKNADWFITVLFYSSRRAEFHGLARGCASNEQNDILFEESPGLIHKETGYGVVTAGGRTGNPNSHHETRAHRLEAALQGCLRSPDRFQHCFAVSALS